MDPYRAPKILLNLPIKRKEIFPGVFPLAFVKIDSLKKITKRYFL